MVSLIFPPVDICDLAPGPLECLRSKYWLLPMEITQWEPQLVIL